MQFLETIEGRSGEELASAVLKFLLVNSSTMRGRFVRRLAGQLPPSQVPTFRDGIICQCEYPTKDGDVEGSLDLLIREESRMVFGVENKFWADFTDGQPRKYLPTLRQLVRGDESACKIVLLFPNQRRADVESHVAQQGIRADCLFVEWEDIQEDLQEIGTSERMEVAAAALFLEEYVAKQVLETRIGITAFQLLGKDVHVGNQFHYDFLYKLKGCFPKPGGLYKATSWIGFHFRLLPDNDFGGQPVPKQWFGFYDKHPDGVILGINTGMTDYKPPSQEGIDRTLTLWGNVTFLKLSLLPRLTTTIEWKNWLEPVLDDIRNVLTERLRALGPSPGAAISEHAAP